MVLIVNEDAVCVRAGGFAAGSPFDFSNADLVKS